MTNTTQKMGVVLQTLFRFVIGSQRFCSERKKLRKIIGLFLEKSEDTNFKTLIMYVSSRGRTSIRSQPRARRHARCPERLTHPSHNVQT